MKTDALLELPHIWNEMKTRQRYQRAEQTAGWGVWSVSAPGDVTKEKFESFVLASTF